MAERVRADNGASRDLLTDVNDTLLHKIQAATLHYKYKGIPTVKNPFDFALYTSLLWQLKPRTIIEIGSNFGGSALWLADQARAMQLGAHVFSLDNRPVNVQDPLVTFMTEDLTNLSTAMSPAWVASLPRPLLVIEDASHVYNHTLLVLRHFAGLMRKGEYIVIEDAIVTALGIAESYRGGPGRAITEFLSQNKDYEVDEEYCDFFGHNVTWNVNGYLRKIA